MKENESRNEAFLRPRILPFTNSSKVGVFRRFAIYTKSLTQSKIEMELIGHNTQSLGKITQEKVQGVKTRQLYAQTHNDKFSWEFEDLEFLSEAGEWISGNALLRRSKKKNTDL